MDTQCCFDFPVLRRVEVLPSNLYQTINFSLEHDRSWCGEITSEKSFTHRCSVMTLFFYWWSLVGSRCHGLSLPNAIPPCGGAPEASASKRWERRIGSSCTTEEWVTAQERPLFSWRNITIAFLYSIGTQNTLTLRTWFQWTSNAQLYVIVHYYIILNQETDSNSNLYKYDE